MSRTTIGVIDYGAGNLTSVWRALHSLGYRCRITRDMEGLNETDMLLLPGVGAFPSAMAALHRHGLIDYLQTQAREGRPFLGICLGMQLMADASTEHGTTAGLGLIPGNVISLGETRGHIGWNTMEVVSDDPMFKPSDGRSFYFNHSYTFDAPTVYQVGIARLPQPVTVAVRRDNMVGLQFHPEKSQMAGRQLLRNTIEGLCRD